MAASLTFVDTNVLAYAHDTTAGAKQQIASALIAALWESRSGVLSTQVLQEFYVVTTRKFRRPLSRKQARELVTAYGTWRLVPIDMPLIVDASVLEERHRMSFWDALIVVAAQQAGASRVVSEDLQAGRRFDHLRVENPFGRRAS